MEGISGLVFILIVLFLIILVILWILLPFLIMGTNRRLDRLISLLQESNHLNNEIAGDLSKLAGEAEKTLRK